MILYNKDGEPIEITEKSINSTEVIKRFEDIDSDSTHLYIDSTLYTEEEQEQARNQFTQWLSENRQSDSPLTFLGVTFIKKDGSIQFVKAK